MVQTTLASEKNARDKIPTCKIFVDLYLVNLNILTAINLRKRSSCLSIGEWVNLEVINTSRIAQNAFVSDV